MSSLGYGESWGSDAPRLRAFLGPNGSAYLCARADSLPADEVLIKDTRSCSRCGHDVWFDAHSYALASELGEAKIICSTCMEDLLK